MLATCGVYLRRDSQGGWYQCRRYYGCSPPVESTVDSGLHQGRVTSAVISIWEIGSLGESRSAILTQGSIGGTVHQVGSVVYGV